MKKLLFCRKCLCAAFNRIPLVDKCLLVFFLVLLTQSAYSLFSHNGTGSEIEHIKISDRQAANPDCHIHRIILPDYPDPSAQCQRP